MSPAQRLKKMEFNATFLATIISFLVFVILMNKILYAPILGIMEARRNFIEGNFADADKNNSKSEELVKQKEEKLSGAKEDARSKYLESIDEFKTKKSEVIKAAQDLAKEEINNSNIELVRLSDEVKDSLKGSISGLADDIVEKLIGYRSENNVYDENLVNEAFWGER